MRLAIYVENDSLDLYEDETIDLKSSVQDVNDITINTTDYTKTFKVPASRRNNRIFKHYYDASIDNTFDARIKIDARIEFDGMVFRYGKFTLTSVDVKHGKPSSYSVVFYGSLVNIKDKAGDKYLSEIDLSAFNHDYNPTNTVAGMTTGLFSGNVVYPLMVGKQYYYSSDATDNTTTDTLANIAYNSSGSTNGIRATDLKFSIKLIRVLEAVEEYIGIQFSRDFFGRDEFTNIYMWLNNDTVTDVGNTITRVDFDGGDDTFMDLTTDIGTYNVGNTGASNDRKIWLFTLDVTPSAGYESVYYVIDVYVNGTSVKQWGYVGYASFTYTLEHNGEFVDWDVDFTVTSSVELLYTASLEQKLLDAASGTFTYDTTASANSVTPFININDNIPKIKIIDFLKGLFQMYKLVVIQEDPLEDIYVNTLKDYYSEGVAYDLTPYIDSSEHTVKRGELLNTIRYEFAEPQTVLNMQFENNTGLGYGDEEAVLENEDGELLDGDSLEIEVPFEQVVYERLPDIETDETTNIQYGAIIDESLEAINIETHLHYVSFNDLETKTVALITQAGTRQEVNSLILPSHELGFNIAQHSLIFSAEYSTYNGELIANTLYNNWHRDFIKSIFNIKRRTFIYKAFNLPYRYLMSLRLNDVVQIRENFYRINSFNTNLSNGNVSFELINSFDNVINSFDESQTIVISDASASTERVYIGNYVNDSKAIIDTGDGTTWLTANLNGKFLDVVLDANTGVEREAKIEVKNADKTKSKNIIVRQLE